MSSLHQGRREIEDQWDFPLANDWIKYCHRHPPLQAMVEAYLGLGEANKPMRLTEENFGEFLQMLSAESKVGGNA